MRLLLKVSSAICFMLVGVNSTTLFYDGGVINIVAIAISATVGVHHAFLLE